MINVSLLLLLAIAALASVPLLASDDYTDEQVANLRLTQVLLEIRECQLMQKDSMRSTFTGSMGEFVHAHEVMAEVMRDDPVEKQKRLLVELRRINREYDNELFERCRRHADTVSGWDQQ